MRDIEQFKELKKQIEELTKSLAVKNAVISDHEKSIAKSEVLLHQKQERISTL